MEMLETRRKSKVVRGDSWTAVALSKNSPFLFPAFRLFVCSILICLITCVNTQLIRAYQSSIYMYSLYYIAYIGAACVLFPTLQVGVVRFLFLLLLHPSLLLSRLLTLQIPFENRP